MFSEMRLEFVLTRISFVLANKNLQTALFQTGFAFEWFENFVKKNVCFLDWRLWMSEMHLQHVEMHGDNVLLRGICFLENEMHCCMPWFKHVHARIKEPNAAPTSIVASSQDTFELLCLFVLREKRRKSKAISWEV